ncbi:hypothetical protein Dimus_027123, partial [Dionaea muscipula]
HQWSGDDYGVGDGDSDGSGQIFWSTMVMVMVMVSALGGDSSCSSTAVAQLVDDGDNSVEQVVVTMEGSRR